MLYASTQAGDHGHPRAFARVEVFVLSTIDKSARPSASLKGRRKVQFIFWKFHVDFCSVDNNKQYRMLYASTQAGGVELSVLPIVENIQNKTC